MIASYGLHDVVQTKKSHPCGSDRWEIIRVGADIKIRCCGCRRIVMLPRNEFEKRVRKVFPAAVESEGNKV